jgi:small subunit ribosomal protein S29
MASTALRCLTRARPAAISVARVVTPAAPASLALAASFSTASRLENAKGKHIIKGKGKKNYKKKGAAIVKHKTPGPGERKAFRKRIQISNNNALPVTGLGDMSRESLASDEAEGRVLGLPDTVVDQLRALEAFRPNQSWGLFRRPHVLVRSESVKLGKMMEGAKKERTTVKLILDGGKATGKSTMMLQAMAHAFINKWIVIHIPEGMSNLPRYRQNPTSPKSRAPGVSCS